MKMASSPLSLRAQFSSKARVKYQTFALNPDGSKIPFGPPRKNLILDTGLDFLNPSTTISWSGAFRYAAIGLNTGNEPTSRASGGTTFTQVANALTASGAFFNSGDVGRLFKYGIGAGGVEMYITAYIDTLNVTVSVSATVASPDVGTIWYVNETALDSEFDRTPNVLTGLPNNFSSVANTTITHQRTFLFPAVGSTTTIKEIGWSPGPGAYALFGRDVITPGDTLVTGQQYLVVVQVIVDYSGAGGGFQGNTGSGCDNTAQARLENLFCSLTTPDGFSNASVSTGGDETTHGCMDFIPGACAMGLISANYAQNGSTDNTGTTLAVTLSNTSTANVGSYASGAFANTLTSAVFAVGTLPNPIYGYCLCGNGTSAFANAMWDCKFLTPIATTNLQTFQFVFAISWGRVLSN